MASFAAALRVGPAPLCRPSTAGCRRRPGAGCARLPRGCESTSPYCTCAACGSPVTGPLRYWMTGRQVARLVAPLDARVVIPVHYEGWSHLVQGRAAVERQLGQAPDDVRWRFRWLPLGEPVEVGTA